MENPYSDLDETKKDSSGKNMEGNPGQLDRYW